MVIIRILSYEGSLVHPEISCAIERDIKKTTKCIAILKYIYIEIKKEK